MSRRVVLASDNRHKFREFSALLADVCNLIPQSAFRIKTPPEDGETFEDNARLKALHACAVSGLPAIADDSGLEVDALDGAPGIFSARYSGENASDADNLQKLLRDIENLSDDSLNARFYCALAYAVPGEEQPLTVSARWTGRLIRTPAGGQGFGYDPIFYVPEYSMTAAELDPQVKNVISHRGQALKKLHALLLNRSTKTDGNKA